MVDRLKRSYKYMMYATKTPSLRIDQSDLKCKSGCDFYGNVQWQGYCSKCHREQVHRQRKAEKNNAETAGVREHQTLERQPKTTQIAGFSKFEEKKLRQTDSLKKSKLLKLNVFRKSSNAKDVGPPDREFKSRNQSTLVSSIVDQQKKDFMERFPRLDQTIERDANRCIQYIFSSISKQCQLKSIDELSEMVQNYYQHYAKTMDERPHYSEIDGETRELLLDFVEKHAMSNLHSLIFSSFNSDDEKKDAQLHARIRQLSWVSPTHLDCKIDQTNTAARDLLYTAITELVAVDSVLSPGEKLAHIVGCCRGVVGVVSAASGKPASADDLLPALIFTVLKANPPRLTSNINFITRFCNAARLMTGEGGYYFTNLCCAVSFIENLTPESLNLTKEDFNRYMNLPAGVKGGSWVAALSLCEGLHNLQDELQNLKELESKADKFAENVDDINEQISVFKEEIIKKVADVLSRTPLEFKSRKGLKAYIPSFIEDPEIETIETRPVVDVVSVDGADDIFGPCGDDSTAALIESAKISDQSFDYESYLNKKQPPPPNTLSMPLNNTPVSTLKAFGSSDFLSPSPIFGFNSLDESVTPDEFGNEQIAQRLSAVSYDIDLSDPSTENSVADDAPDKPKPSRDPFSPDGLVNPVYETIWSHETRPLNLQAPLVPNVENGGAVSILDSNDSPTVDALLPSPIKPLNTFQPFDFN